MNFHTIELYYKLSLTELSYIKDILWKSGKKTYPEKINGIPILVSESLAEYGIVIRIHEYITDNYKYAGLYYRINPRRMFETGNYVGIFNSKNTDRLVEKFNSLVQSVSYMLPEFDSCILHRIDYCSNVELSGQDEVCEYVKLLKRGYIPPKYGVQLYDDKKAKRRKMSKNGITIRGSNGVEITYYNKFRQLKDEDKWLPDIDRANDIIRIEIRCNRKKIKHLSDKYGCTKVSTFLKHSDIIGNYVFKHYANIFYGTGDFYKLDTIINKINNASVKEKSKKVMKEVVTLSAKHSSLQKSFRVLGLTDKERKAIIKKFNKIGVSPVVIPRRSEFDTFSNPLTLALEWSEFDDLFE